MEPTEGPKKRGRKKKEPTILNVNETPAAPKKRGRKPKGGKIISKIEEPTNNHILTNNVILHLKCSMTDIIDNSVTELKYKPDVPSIKTIETDNTFSYINPANGLNDDAYNNTENGCPLCKSKEITHNNNNDDDINIKDLDDKLKSLKIKLYNNVLPNVKSSCFWCTCSYDTPLCVIPNEITNDEIIGYGSFCRPECAVSFLFKENIDDALKFERYQLLNSIYSKVYNYSKNIKPAPDPYYLLDKFYGTMTIQEYRKILGSQHLLLVIDKPMTRTLPELHEDNDCFVNDLYVSKKNENTNQNTGKYKVKRESEKKTGPSKKSLIEEHFKLK